MRNIMKIKAAYNVKYKYSNNRYKYIAKLWMTYRSYYGNKVLNKIKTLPHNVLQSILDHFPENIKNVLHCILLFNYSLCRLKF